MPSSCRTRLLGEKIKPVTRRLWSFPWRLTPRAVRPASELADYRGCAPDVGITGMDVPDRPPPSWRNKAAA